MKTLQQIIDERHEVSNALFKARSKALRTGLKIQKQIDEKERIKTFVEMVFIGIIFVVGVLIISHYSTKDAIENCLKTNSQDYCEQVLGAR